MVKAYAHKVVNVKKLPWEREDSCGQNENRQLETASQTEDEIKNLKFYKS